MLNVKKKDYYVIISHNFEKLRLIKYYSIDKFLQNI